MTDLHTHILPGMDDGANSVEESLAMLQMEADQGVNRVALTPHFYSVKEDVPSFLSRRDAAYKELLAGLEGRACPELILGAEVAFMPGISDVPDLDKLCYEGTRILLVELPMTSWTDDIFRQLHRLESNRGLMPMIAHIDRYIHCQKKEQLERLLEMGYPIQVSAGAFLRNLGRVRALRLIRDYDALLITDCHSTGSRCPKIEEALKIVKKKLGSAVADRASRFTDEVLYD